MSYFFDLPKKHGYVTRMVSGENLTGEKGGGARATTEPPYDGAARRLGKGWKVHPFIDIKSGETATLMDVDGPGVITYMWFATEHNFMSEIVIRFYWDDEQEPSVEVPLGAFFAMGHDFARHTVTSAMVTVAPKSGLNCYWPMPFRKHAKVTLENQSDDDVKIVAYKIMYDLKPVDESDLYFHAQYRRTLTTVQNPEHTIVDGIKGEGCYAGTYLAWNPFCTGWWGEGEVKFYMDGDGEYPTICDTGTEDYFGGAWNYGASGQLGVKSLQSEQWHDIVSTVEEVYNAPFCGVPLALTKNPNGPRKFSMYRWHANDAIAFLSDLKVTVQSLAWLPDSTYRPSVDDIASVAYWYQTEPHNPFPQLPSKEERWDR